MCAGGHTALQDIKKMGGDGFAALPDATAAVGVPAAPCLSQRGRMQQSCLQIVGGVMPWGVMTIAGFFLVCVLPLGGSVQKFWVGGCPNPPSLFG